MKSRRPCPKHGKDYPCTCAMGNLYRFVEPAILLLLKEKGEAHGYSLASAMGSCALTDADVDPGALYRTLRTLECNGFVVSRWEAEHPGPARRIYRLTAQGEQHLDEWASVLGHLAGAMSRFVERVTCTQTQKAEPPRKSKRPRLDNTEASPRRASS